MFEKLKIVVKGLPNLGGRLLFAINLGISAIAVNAQDLNATLEISVNGEPVITARQIQQKYGSGNEGMAKYLELAYQVRANTKVPISVHLLTADGKKTDITTDPGTRLLLQFPDVATVTPDRQLAIKKDADWPEGFAGNAPLNLAIGYESTDASGKKILAYDVAHMRAIRAR